MIFLIAENGDLLNPEHHRFRCLLAHRKLRLKPIKMYSCIFASRLKQKLQSEWIWKAFDGNGMIYRIYFIVITWCKHLDASPSFDFIRIPRSMYVFCSFEWVEDAVFNQQSVWWTESIPNRKILSIGRLESSSTCRTTLKIQGAVPPESLQFGGGADSVSYLEGGRRRATYSAGHYPSLCPSSYPQGPCTGQPIADGISLDSRLSRLYTLESTCRPC